MIEKWLEWLGAWVIVEEGLKTKARLEEAIAAWRSLFPKDTFRGAVK